MPHWNNHHEVVVYATNFWAILRRVLSVSANFFDICKISALIVNDAKEYYIMTVSSISARNVIGKN